MTKEEILNKLEEIQNKYDGIIGQNEYDLFVRDDIADFIIQQTSELKAELNELKDVLIDVKNNWNGDKLVGGTYEKIFNVLNKQKFESNA